MFNIHKNTFWGECFVIIITFEDKFCLWVKLKEKKFFDSVLKIVMSILDYYVGYRILSTMCMLVIYFDNI